MDGRATIVWRKGLAVGEENKRQSSGSAVIFFRCLISLLTTTPTILLACDILMTLLSPSNFKLPHTISTVFHIQYVHSSTYTLLIVSLTVSSLFHIHSHHFSTYNLCSFLPSMFNIRLFLNDTSSLAMHNKCYIRFPDCFDEG